MGSWRVSCDITLIIFTLYNNNRFFFCACVRSLNDTDTVYRITITKKNVRWKQIVCSKTTTTTTTEQEKWNRWTKNWLNGDEIERILYISNVDILLDLKRCLLWYCIRIFELKHPYTCSKLCNFILGISGWQRHQCELKNTFYIPNWTDMNQEVLKLLTFLLFHYMDLKFPWHRINGDKMLCTWMSHYHCPLFNHCKYSDTLFITYLHQSRSIIFLCRFFFFVLFFRFLIRRPSFYVLDLGFVFFFVSQKKNSFYD